MGWSFMIFSKRKSSFTFFILFVVSITLQSCATLDPNYEQPTVTLKSFRALPSEGMVPNFEIGLNVLNPNDSPFQLVGVVYTVSIQGHDIVKGVGKDFPVIESYSEETIKLTATANLFAGVRLIMDLMKSAEKDLQFEFEAKLDTGGFGPSIRIKEKGNFRLDGKNRVPEIMTPEAEKDPKQETKSS